MKVQIVADASTRDVACISVGKGKQHDFNIFQESEVHFTPQTQVIADREREIFRTETTGCIVEFEN